MADETLRAVVVGCGVGRNHADAYTHSDAAELVALCDIDEVPLNRVADANDVEARYTDFETMLREEQPDLINIATAQPLHAEMTVLAATQYTPKGILCEKGMANNMGEARAMLAACDRNGVKLAIGHESRYLTQIQEARELITGGAIGNGAPGTRLVRPGRDAEPDVPRLRPGHVHSRRPRAAVGDGQHSAQFRRLGTQLAVRGNGGRDRRVRRRLAPDPGR